MTDHDGPTDRRPPGDNDWLVTRTWVSATRNEGEDTVQTRHGPRYDDDPFVGSPDREFRGWTYRHRGPQRWDYRGTNGLKSHSRWPWTDLLLVDSGTWGLGTQAPPGVLVLTENGTGQWVRGLGSRRGRREYRGRLRESGGGRGPKEGSQGRASGVEISEERFCSRIVG